MVVVDSMSTSSSVSAASTSAASLASFELDSPNTAVSEPLPHALRASPAISRSRKVRRRGVRITVPNLGAAFLSDRKKFPEFSKTSSGPAVPPKGHMVGERRGLARKGALDAQPVRYDRASLP